MDLPLWDPPDGQEYQTSFKSNSTEDHSPCDFSFGYGRDTIEEDALNEKSCIQVLRILIDKADEEIQKLEEDITMLQCQLAWDDKDWSKQCSFTLRKNIYELDTLIRRLKKGARKTVRDFSVKLDQPEKLPQRIHDLVKPTLEKYFLEKRKQMESNPAAAAAAAAAELSKKRSVAGTSKNKKNVEAKKSTNQPKNNQRKCPSTQPKERKINHHQQKEDIIISESIANDGLCEKDINKLNRRQRKRIPSSAPVKSGKRKSNKSEPSNPLVKDSSPSASVERAGSRERDKSGNTGQEAISEAKSKPADAISDSQLDCVKQTTKASSEI